MSDQDPAETGLSTSAQNRRLQGELAEVRRKLSVLFSACEELGRLLTNEVIAKHHLRDEVRRLRDLNTNREGTS